MDNQEVERMADSVLMLDASFLTLIKDRYSLFDKSQLDQFSHSWYRVNMYFIEIYAWICQSSPYSHSSSGKKELKKALRAKLISKKAKGMNVSTFTKILQIADLVN